MRKKLRKGFYPIAVHYASGNICYTLYANISIDYLHQKEKVFCCSIDLSHMYERRLQRDLKEDADINEFKKSLDVHIVETIEIFDETLSRKLMHTINKYLYKDWGLTIVVDLGAARYEFMRNHMELGPYGVRITLK